MLAEDELPSYFAPLVEKRLGNEYKLIAQESSPDMVVVPGSHMSVWNIEYNPALAADPIEDLVLDFLELNMTAQCVR